MVEIINKILWAIATIFLVGGGLYFSFLYKFIQFDIKNMFKSFKKDDSSDITPFQTLTMALGARIGVGSLAGIALAIHIGGIGTVFWIWISSIITSSNAFVESALAVIFRKKKNKGSIGGPAFYIEKGLKSRKWACIYAILVIVAYIFGFLTIQTNTIARSLNDMLNISPLIVGIVVALLAGIIIFGGVKSIAKATSKLVPVMGLGYLLVGLVIVYNNISIVPELLFNIVKEAFNVKSLGVGVLTAFIIGVQRGVFSNEAGIGTGAIVSASADSDNAVGQGLIQVIGIYFTSLIVCTMTAFIILTSNYNTISFENINGIEITSYALNYHMGNFGNVVLVLAILFFSFSTIISGYYYGESNLSFLFPSSNKKMILILKIITILLLVYGSIASPSSLWNAVDILVAIMAIINVVALFRLKDEVRDKLKVYKKNGM